MIWKNGIKKEGFMIKIIFDFKNLNKEIYRKIKINKIK